MTGCVVFALSLLAPPSVVLAEENDKSEEKAKAQREQAEKVLLQADRAAKSKSVEIKDDEKHLTVKLYSVSGMAFTGTNIIDQAKSRVLRQGGYISGAASNPVNNDEYVATPVYLPDGVKVKSLKGYLYANQGTGYVVTLYLQRSKKADGTATRMASLITPMSRDAIQQLTTTTISDSTIDNTQYTYYLIGYVSSQLTRIYAADIRYE